MKKKKQYSALFATKQVVACAIRCAVTWSLYTNQNQQQIP
jgi:uncharacterized Fe-S cluster-containing radical SAM superfamily protein